jgi:hypothetical protein
MTLPTSADMRLTLGLDARDESLALAILNGVARFPLRCYPERIRRYVAYLREQKQQQKKPEGTRYSSL